MATMAVKEITLVILVLMCVSSLRALDRCLKTHRDQPCIANDVLPITLECRYPGMWFTVKKTEVQSKTGAWVQVYEEKTAESQCKKSRGSSNTTPGNYECDVSSLGLHGHGANVRITYYCWEFDPDNLGGFGRKREKFPDFPWSYDIQEDV